MGLFDKYGTRSNERARAKKELQLKLFLVAGALLFFAAVWLLSQLGPRAVDDLDHSEWTEEVTDESLKTLEGEVEGYVQKFRTLRDSGGLSEEDLMLIELAIDKQAELIHLKGSERSSLSDSERLKELKRFRDEVKGAVLAKRVEASLQVAHEAIREGNRTLGEEELERAIIFQDRINREFSSSQYRNLAFARTLELELEELRAEPISIEANQLIKEGLAKKEEQAFGEAVKLFEEALALKNRLARDFGSTRFVSRQDLIELEQLIVDSKAGDLGMQFTAIKAKALVLLEADKYDEAEKAITEAQQLYATLKDRYKKSSLVSAQTEEVLERERQTVLSAPLVKKVNVLRLELREALRNRETVRAAELVAELYRNTRRLDDSFKMSQLVEGQWLLEARFLNHVRYDLGVIQDNIYAALLPIPGYPSKKMLGNEVSQGLYRLVSGENPSSQVDERNPVESLTREAAQRFCERVSWIFGYEAILPSRDEFLAALGEFKRTELEQMAWHSQNSGRSTREVASGGKNSFGFHDLLGNVAEWTRDSKEEESGNLEALVLGGSVRDSVLGLSRIPEEWVNPSDRNRFIGFRVVVDFKSH